MPLSSATTMTSRLLASKPTDSKNQLATFAAGCFWGVEKYFVKQFPEPAILRDSVRVGYTGGKVQGPTYHDVCTGSTGHAEAIRFEFDPAKVSYAVLLDFFFSLHDPTTLNQQGNDVGSQYRSAIFTHSQVQHETALKSIDTLQGTKISKKIVTQIAEAGDFWEAEKDHQRYLERHPSGYCNHHPRW